MAAKEQNQEMKVTDEQLNTTIKEPDLPELAACFDNVHNGYLEKLELLPGEQTDVRTRAYVDGTLAGMLLALKCWILTKGLEATFRALLLISLSLLKENVAVRVCKYLFDKFSISSPPSRERVLLNHKLSSYRDYLQSRYRAQISTSATQWPPVPTKKVFKLAMIQKEKIQRGRIDEEFFRLSITGKIDDILLKKTPVNLLNIFSEIGDRRKFVLIEGAPGSGKSTLALHICQEWAKGKLFQEFDIAILVRLRDPLVKEAITISDLLPCTNKAMANETDTAIMSLYGKGVLWVLDGWDELPSDLPRDSIINKLIRPYMSRESPLHESAVIVTSRPSSSAELHPLVSSRVEVLGFTPHQLEQYFTECLQGDLQAVQTLLERIRENPMVESSCYLPLNASIVVNCFLSDNHSLPTSNHGIFKSVVQSSLKRYLQDKLGKTTPVGDITSPDSLPSEIRTQSIQMCQLAFHGIEENKVTFTDTNLATLSIPKDISNIGLLQTVSSITSDGHLVYYCFLHLSIQELLAAVHISLMSPKQQIYVFQKLFDNPRFSAVFQFYAGITKLRTSRPILSMLPRFLCPFPISIFDLLQNIVKSEKEKKSYEPKILLLSLINCLYEAEDSSLCAFVANLLNHYLDLDNTTMNPINCLCVGYFASYFASVCDNTCKEFTLRLRSCYIDDQGCKFLAQGLCKCSYSRSKITLYLHNNYIREEGIRHIAEVIESTSLISKLILSNNSIGNSGLSTLCEALSTNTSLKNLILYDCSLSLNDHGAIPRLLSTNNTTLEHLSLSRNVIGNTELKNLCEALWTNTSLKRLDLECCSLTISDDNGAVLYQLLNHNNSLEHLNLSSNTVTSCRHIAAGLAVNKTLRTLNLGYCKLTDQSIEELSAKLINKLKTLYIWGNDTITKDGMKTLARHLTTHCSELTKLLIPSRLISCINTVFWDANKERKRNGLPEINVGT
ncbi:NACHT, LRR and PYD domains-containing protein 12-like isoform X2 [Halichondria panicea]|uniref:NACHT, LRR and PYD domains-containing protein 12-like isoform X2 n=1 Tax=Halichondria panicea TaxID=6063 RepID=UPI00312B6CD8